MLSMYFHAILSVGALAGHYARSVLDALEQGIWSGEYTSNLIHHIDRGRQYLSICYTEKLAETGIEASFGSVGESYDNALAETINGLYKTEVIRHPWKRPWKTIVEVEYATLSLSKVIRIDESEIRGKPDEMVLGTVEKSLEYLLDSEADEMCDA